MKKIKIKRFDKNLSLPEYKTADAVRFDLTAREARTVKPVVVEKGTRIAPGGYLLNLPVPCGKKFRS